MYADRLESESGTRKLVKDRINGGSSDNSTPSRKVTGKRQRQEDDKWEHDLFSSDKPQLSNRRVDSRDLRVKLQKRHHVSQGGREGGSGVRDLRETLSGTMNTQHPPKSKVETARPSLKSVVTETATETTRKTPSQATRKKSQQMGASVDNFLESLGLEKYSTAFQVEEVDMDALMHMTDDDLKAMLIPMGPRKKILLALGSKR
ncbi:Sterile alpha motif (SAM) domain-containing protein [Raphanus sativus]|uniref:Uncharacterized protein LOC108857381 n=1 Tax=Raphanus sativus TaxID=3726 RepID=A0A6J0NQA4_RAPSA|nr:uncharacterized protein LOC108857381 [Raphanus sativus]KAJ4898379.1 Sterile alpha motif (SAM) domain-containing protein [Raphanus sativus]